METREVLGIRFEYGKKGMVDWWQHDDERGWHWIIQRHNLIRESYIPIWQVYIADANRANHGPLWGCDPHDLEALMKETAKLVLKGEWPEEVTE